MTAPALQVTDLTVRYGELTALDGAAFILQRGRVCGLIGMNGSGKSTLLKAIMGIVRPDAGHILIDGASPGRARRSGRVGYVPQSEDVDWDFPVSVREVAMMGRYGRMGLTRRPKPADHRAVDEALERVGLGDEANRQIGQLSGGQRKRAFLARAIAQEAALLLLDEPFAGIDQLSEAAITELLRQLAADGRTILVSTHDLHGLPELADEAVLLMKRVLMHGDPSEVLTPRALAMAFGLDDVAMKESA